MRVRNINNKTLLQVTLVVVGSCFILKRTSASASSQPTDKIEPVPVPRAPIGPNCGNSFPGTPKWNQCWDRFRMDMQNFQFQMQQFGDKISQVSVQNGAYNSQSSSTSCSGGKCLSTTTINGYRIQTQGVSISTETRDSKLHIKLILGNYDSFETNKLEKNEMELKWKSQDQKKWARIRIPDDVKLADLKIERSFDTIMITGPMKTKFEHKSSSSYSTSSHPEFNQNPNFNMMMQPGFPFGPPPPGFNNIGNHQFHQNPFQTTPQMWMF